MSAKKILLTIALAIILGLVVVELMAFAFDIRYTFVIGFGAGLVSGYIAAVALLLDVRR